MEEVILIIEDEENHARFIELELLHEGYQVEKAGDGRMGLELFESHPFDLVLLDIMLPGLNGLEVLRRIRKNSDCPVILLTARDSVMDKVGGLDGGADDYITKPFAIEELLARIRAALRKKAAASKNMVTLSLGDLSLNIDQHMAYYQDTPLELTKREFDLLRTLLENKGVVLTREVLLSQVWGYSYMGETNVVDVYIGYLRNKIDDAFGVKLIYTIRGVGYIVK
jgi:DNA-binding response OmpR family regulator